MYCTVKEGELITFGYTNWKGVMSVRKAIVKEFYFGKTEYHTDYQMLIRAFDVEKLVERTFAVKDMKEVEVVKF